LFENNSFRVKPGFEYWPVVWVTWYGAKAFALHNGYDLPTEAEWEYACQGGRQYQYGTSENVINFALANYFWGLTIMDVGSYATNPFGLYDLSGNVEEWCHDLYGSYSFENENNPVGAEEGQTRVSRGGSWRSSGINCRSSYRIGYSPENRNGHVGFRVVRRAGNLHY
jgi:formylglycine-generating enzyme